jgi:chromosome partitioning protein
MPLVIAVVALKGGAGKTTIATNAAEAFQFAGHKVLLVDADSQGTSRTWAEVAAASGLDVPPVVSMSGAQLRKDVARVGAPYDIVIIDTPARLNVEGRSALLVADLVILPVTPGGADVWSLAETLSVVEDARALRPELKVAILQNRVDNRTVLAGELARALKDATAPVLKATIGQRVAYAEALTTGRGVISYAPRSAAAKEVQVFAREVLRLLREGPVAA